MQRWRYHSLVLRDLSVSDGKLTAEGLKGWELVSVCMMDSNTARAFFKKLVTEEEFESEQIGDMAVATHSAYR